MTRQSESEWLLPRRPVYYLEMGRLTEQVVRDSRLEAKSKLFVLALAFLVGQKGSPVSWAEIEAHTGAKRGELYWTETVNGKMKRPSPVHQAILSGYVGWKKGRNSGVAAEYWILPWATSNALNQTPLSDAPHQARPSSDAPHQARPSSDAPHQLADAPHQLADAPHQLADAPHQQNKLPSQNSFPKPEQTQDLSSSSQSVLNPASSPRAKSVISERSGDLRSGVLHSDVQSRASVDNFGDNPPSRGAKFGGLTNSQLITMRIIFEESGLPGHVVEDCMEFALRAVVEHGVAPSQIVAAQKILKAHFGKSAHEWPEQWRKMIGKAIERRMRPGNSS